MTTTTPARIASTAAAVAAVLEHAHHASLPEPRVVQFGYRTIPPTVQLATFADLAEWALHLGARITSEATTDGRTLHAAVGSSLELPVRAYTVTEVPA